MNTPKYLGDLDGYSVWRAELVTSSRTGINCDNLSRGSLLTPSLNTTKDSPWNKSNNYGFSINPEIIPFTFICLLAKVYNQNNTGETGPT